MDLLPGNGGRAEVTINGSPIDWAGRLVSLTLTDYRGFEADALEITIDDHDGLVELPETKAEVGLKLGFETLVDKGTYIVNEVEYLDPPAHIIIRALSADISGKLQAQKTKAWHEVTLGDILTTIATTHDLTPAIADEYKTIAIEHIDQTNESDAHFLTRLGIDYGAIATVKNGHLLFMRLGSSKTVSGTTIPTRVLERHETYGIRYLKADSNGAYTGVKAKWHNLNTGQVAYELAGTDDNPKTLKKTYFNANAALHAAKSEWQRAQGRKAEMSFTLSTGDPGLIPENPISLIGFKKAISTQGWRAVELTHTLDGALTTGLVLEVV